MTSYNELRREALACDRWNLLNPGEKPRVPYITQLLTDQPYPVIATGDYMKAVPDQIARWIPGPFQPLGTDGFGRSEARKELRDYFEIDGRYVTLAALQQLAKIGQFDAKKLGSAARTLEIDSNKIDPTAPPTSDLQFED